MKRRRFVIFAAAAIVGSLAATTAVLVGADLYAHRRVERSVGVNRRGYRGPVVGPKTARERRVVMLGGSTVFGWEVAWDDTIPAALERELRQTQPAARVINLGFIGEGAYAFLPTLQDFASLDYDVAILYEGYNDLLGDARPNTDLWRHSSAIFRATGYFPILPLVLSEKAKALRYGDVGVAYNAARGETVRTVFRPGLMNRTSAAALDAAAAVASTLGRQLDRMSGTPVFAPTGKAGCSPPWVHYCESVYTAAHYGAGRGAIVLVVAQPLLKTDRGAAHAQQQDALADMMARMFSSQARVRYLDLRAAVDLSRRDLAFDGLHLNPAGNTIIAKALRTPVEQALEDAARATRP